MVSLNFLKSRPLQLTLFVVVFSISSPGYSIEKTDSKQLVLELEKKESTLGRPIRAELFAINIRSKLSDINLSVLNKNFGVVIDYSIDNTTDIRWPNKTVQILKFKIYPKTTGNIVFPKLKFEGAISNSNNIIVSQGTTSTPVVSLSTNSPFEKQQIIVHVDILSSEPTSRLTVNNKSLIKNFDSIPLKFERLKNKSGLYQLKIGWAITAVKSGTFELQLPEVEYSKSGVFRKRFYLPSRSIKIKALPAYLPPTIPVGKINIQATLPDKLWLRSNSINYWNIKLTGNINSSYNLPPILRQIKNNSRVKFSPVTTTRVFNQGVNNLTSQVTHSIPFKALSSGFLTFPKIELQYFDPVNNKIITITHKSKNIFVFSLFLEIILTLIIFSIFLYVFKLIYKKWQELQFSRAKTNEAILLLQDSTISSLRSAIKLLIEAEFWPHNITIKQWGERWKRKYQVSDNFNHFINIISNNVYSSSEKGDTKNLCNQLQQLISNKKRIKT